MCAPSPNFTAPGAEPQAPQAFAWHERYASGVDDVDAGRLGLGELIDRVGDLERAGADLDGLRPIIRRLADYAAVHFSPEGA